MSARRMISTLPARNDCDFSTISSPSFNPLIAHVESLAAARREGDFNADALALVRDRLDFLSATERDWLLRRTAEQTFFT